MYEFKWQNLITFQFIHQVRLLNPQATESIEKGKCGSWQHACAQVSCAQLGVVTLMKQTTNADY